MRVLLCSVGSLVTYMYSTYLVYEFKINIILLITKIVVFVNETKPDKQT